MIITDEERSYADFGGSVGFGRLGSWHGGRNREPSEGSSKGIRGPAYAAKAVRGLRFTMEDRWAALPDLVVLPLCWAPGYGEDRLPTTTPPTPAQTKAQEPQARAPACPSPLPDLGADIADPSGDRLHFYAVYDGHGGAEVAKHCAETLHGRLRTLLLQRHPSTMNRAAKCSATSAAPSQPAPAGAGSKAAQAGGAAAEPASAPSPLLDPIAAETSLPQPGWSSSSALTSSSATPPPPSDTLPARGPGDADDQDSASSPHTPSSSQLALAQPGLPVDLAALPLGDSQPLHIESALTKAFVDTDQELFTTRNANEVGTTAVAALVGPNNLWVANTGDSRAVLCRGSVAMPLSCDHKASRRDEMKRVEAAGGYIW